MFHLCILMFSAFLFYVLTPGILLTIPPKSSKKVVALVHALVFAIVWHFTHKIVWQASEGFSSSKSSLASVLGAPPPTRPAPPAARPPTRPAPPAARPAAPPAPPPTKPATPAKKR